MPKSPEVLGSRVVPFCPFFLGGGFLLVPLGPWVPFLFRGHLATWSISGHAQDGDLDGHTNAGSDDMFVMRFGWVYCPEALHENPKP